MIHLFFIYFTKTLACAWSHIIYYIMLLYSDQFQLLFYIQWNLVGWKTTLTPIDFHGMDKNNEVWNDDKYSYINIYFLVIRPFKQFS